MKYRFIQFKDKDRYYGFTKDGNIIKCQIKFQINKINFVYDLKRYASGDHVWKYNRFLSDIDENEIAKDIKNFYKYRIYTDLDVEIKKYNLYQNQMSFSDYGLCYN